jgi:hypothetical protein
MPIKLVQEVNHPKGKPDVTRPICLGEACGEEITRERPGKYVWDGQKENGACWNSEPVEMRLTHTDRTGMQPQEPLG